MAKSKKPRKAYRPHYSRDAQLEAATDALFKRSAESVNQAAADDILLSLDASWLHLRKSTATALDMNALTTAANMAVVLAEKGVGAEFLDVCCKASIELQRVKTYHAQCGRYVASGLGIKLIREMIDVRYAQLTADGYCAGLDYQAAQIVADRMREGCVLTNADLKAA